MTVYNSIISFGIAAPLSLFATCIELSTSRALQVYTAAVALHVFVQADT
jgi:hypothetical protein